MKANPKGASDEYEDQGDRLFDVRNSCESAEAATSASATELTSNTGLGTYSFAGEQEEASTVLSNGVRSISCFFATYTATATLPTTDITVTPTYSGCSANGGIPATVTMNGCKYTLQTNVIGNELTGALTGCNASPNAIEVDIYASGAAHAEHKPLCVLSPAAGSNTDIIGLKATNIPDVNQHREDVTLDLESKNIHIVRKTGTAANCGAATQAAGTLTGSITLKAFQDKAGGAQVGLMVG